MPAANGSAVKYYYCLETAGAISATAPAFLPIRFNTSSIARNTAQVDSNEINSNRQRPVAKQGTYSLSGEIVSELSDDSFDALIEAALQGTWATNVLKIGSTVRSFAILKRHTDIGSTVQGVNISAAAADSSFSSASSAFGVFSVGDIVTVSGFVATGNNKGFKVATATAGKITVTNVDGSAATITTEAAGASVTVKSTEDYLYSGCRVSTMAVSAQIDARVGITFGVIGTEAEQYAVPAGATFAAALTTEPMVTSVGSLTEGGVTQAAVTSLDFTLDNGMAPLHTLFQRAAYDVQNGVATVSGTLSAFRENGKLYAKFLNETETAIVETFSDGVNTRAFTFPKVIYVNADDPVSGPDAIVNQFTFSAGYDGTAATSLTVTRSA